MRYTFGKELAEQMKKDDRIHLLVCDIGFGVFDTINKECPDKMTNVGIAEMAAIGMAAGMAQEGMIPVVYTITPFLLERPFEAIKLCVVQQKQNVKIVGYGDYPNLGPTHISTDVKGLCNCMKLKLYEPETLDEYKKNFVEMFKETSPAFLNLKKA